MSDPINAPSIGKGQFYHYFSSKYDLGLAVVEDIIQEWDKQLLVDIFQSAEESKSKLNNMLNWAKEYHVGMNSHIQGMPKSTGTPFGDTIDGRCKFTG